MNQSSKFLLAIPLLALATSAPAQQLPAAVDAPAKTVVLKVHAEGAQIYECKADRRQAGLGLPRADRLRFSPTTIGRHYAGPNWEHMDGSVVTAKAAGNAPGATAADIPWLKLEVAAHRGSGVLTPVSIVQRIDTHGGKLDGACNKAGDLKSAPYAAEYVFLKEALAAERCFDRLERVRGF